MNTKFHIFTQCHDIYTYKLSSHLNFVFLLNFKKYFVIFKAGKAVI